MKKIVKIVYHKVCISIGKCLNRVLNNIDKTYINIKMQDEYDSKQLISRLKDSIGTMHSIIKLLEEHVQDIEKR